MAHRGPRPDAISPAQVGLLQVESGQIQPLQVEAAQVRPLAPSATATMNPSSSTPMCSFLQARRCFDALCLWTFHSPEPRILSPVESTIDPGSHRRYGLLVPGPLHASRTKAVSLKSSNPDRPPLSDPLSKRSFRSSAGLPA